MYKTIAMLDLSRRYDFIIVAVLFEGGLAAIGAGLAWWFELDPLARLKPGWVSLAWGVAGTIPMILLFLAANRYPIGPLQKIKSLLLELLGPSLAACRWYDLLLIAAVAGFSEELLF